MTGPYPAGHFGALTKPTAWEEELGRLVRGAWYTVVEPFYDTDGTMHPVGETWRYVAGGQAPYDDILLIVFCTNPDEHWAMEFNPDQQQELIDNFQRYVKHCPM